ncbi:hypothetical protein COB21_02660 [Candidatus Aerophobetes bacterium]|uniref:Uncharacterized protein n=1 Tax=Aerophobetes bacterium TaxID=2030807 RepID=A0A2A4X655_UNCAE|nr:MAG: hypothetical protein COB21_02660 [Candidatus Aerophobetes bacterium]
MSTTIGVIATYAAKNTHRFVKHNKLLTATLTLYAIEFFGRKMCKNLLLSQQPGTVESSHLSERQVRLLDYMFKQLAKITPQNPQQLKTLRLCSLAMKVCAIGSAATFASNLSNNRLLKLGSFMTALAALSTGFHLKNFKYEGDLISALLKEKHQAVTTQQDALMTNIEQNHPTLAPFVTPQKDAPAAILNFRGFGESIDKSPLVFVPVFIHTIQNHVINQFNEKFQATTFMEENPGYDMKWLQTADRVIYDKRTANFEKFCALYESAYRTRCKPCCNKRCTSSEKTLSVMQEFAKVYHFETEVGNVDEMRAFLRNANKDALEAKFPHHRANIESIFAPDLMGKTPIDKTPQIKTASQMIDQLIVDWKQSLETSLRAGALTTRYIEITRHLQEVLSPLEAICHDAPIHKKLQGMLDYTTALEKKDELFTQIDQWRTRIQAVAFFSAKKLFSRGDEYYVSSVENLEITYAQSALAASNTLFQRAVSSNYLQNMKSQIEFQQKTTPERWARNIGYVVAFLPAAVFNQTIGRCGRSCKHAVRGQLAYGKTTVKETVKDTLTQVQQTLHQFSLKEIFKRSMYGLQGMKQALTNKAKGFVSVDAHTD